MPYVLGVDFGGTKILAGVVDTDSGEVVGEAKKRTHAERGGDEVVDRLLDVAAEAIENARLPHGALSTAGIGVAGQVAEDGGSLLSTPNLPPEIEGTRLVTAMHDKLGLRTLLFNDVQAAAAGEAAHGAGKGWKEFVVIFIGTGIGGAVYQDGKPYQGATNSAGELGHMVVEYGGRICGCGGEGHLEAYASRTAIVRSILGAMRLGQKSSLADLAPNPDPFNPRESDIRSKALGRAVHEGDPVTMDKISEAARFMGAGLVSIINFYNPPLIILGGGVVEEVDLFFDLAVAYARANALEVPRRTVKFAKAGLGDNSGVVGAATLASRR